MNRAGIARRAGVGLAALGVVAAAAAAPVGVSPAGAVTGPPRAATSTASPVTVSLIGMNPRTPDASKLDQKVTFSAVVTNNSTTTYPDFSVGLERGYPISQQSDLDAAISSPPATDSLQSSNDVDQKRPLGPHQSITVTYLSNPSAGGMCLCQAAVYPYALVVRAGDPTTGMAEVGRTQILVPSFPDPIQPVTVSWLWPLIDRPHRSLGDTVFDDDELAASVSPGGRLFRALAVVENAPPSVRMTLVIDPELIDSLAVMSGREGYTYRSGTAVLKGTGGAAAALWLSRLAALQDREDIQFTGYADPDVNAVTSVGLPYSTALDPQVQARLSSILSAGGNDLAWPAGGALTSKALDATVSAGASTVVLSDAALPGQNNVNPRPDAISSLPSGSGKASALVTDSGIENTIGRIMKLGANPAQDEQTLLSQLAIRPVADGTQSHYVVLAPDRYVDTDPRVADAAIAATVGSSWTKPLSVPKALATVTPVDRGPLQTSAESPDTEVSAAQMAQVVQITGQVAALRDALNSDAALALLGGFKAGLQRAQSSAWRSNREQGAAVTNVLSSAIDARLASVSLVRPAEGTYGLSSSNSPIVVTVVNNLSQDVSVRVDLTPAPGVIGFQAASQPETITANSRKTISIPTHVERLGQFKVTAKLTTPGGQQLGDTVQLSLRSTALGSITKVITIAAASVLVLALLRRFFRLYRHRNRLPPVVTT